MGLSHWFKWFLILTENSNTCFSVKKKSENQVCSVCIRFKYLVDSKYFLQKKKMLLYFNSWLVHLIYRIPKYKCLWFSGNFSLLCNNQGLYYFALQWTLLLHLSSCFWSIKTDKIFFKWCSFGVLNPSCHSSSPNYHETFSVWALAAWTLQRLAVSLLSHILFSCLCWPLIKRAHHSHLQLFTSLICLTSSTKPCIPSLKKHNWLL